MQMSVAVRADVTTCAVLPQPCELTAHGRCAGHEAGARGFWTVSACDRTGSSEHAQQRLTGSRRNCRCPRANDNRWPCVPPMPSGSGAVKSGIILSYSGATRRHFLRTPFDDLGPVVPAINSRHAGRVNLPSGVGTPPPAAALRCGRALTDQILYSTLIYRDLS